MKIMDINNKLHSVNLGDFLAVVFALGYMQSVLTVAHHIAFRTHDGVVRTAESPSISYAVFVGFLVTYLTWKRKGKLSIPSVIALTLVASSSIFWLSGLRTNFYL